MASVTFLEPSGSNLLSSQISRTGLTNLNVTRNNAPWINSNYPEAMGLYGANMAFAEHLQQLSGRDCREYAYHAGANFIQNPERE